RVVELDGQPLPHWEVLRQTLAADPERTFRIAWVSPGGVRHEATFEQERLAHRRARAGAQPLRLRAGTFPRAHTRDRGGDGQRLRRAGGRARPAVQPG